MLEQEAEKRNVFRRWRKVDREGAEITLSRRLFPMVGPKTGKARPPTVDSTTVLILTAHISQGISLRQTVRTHCASVHQAAKLVAALLRVVRVTAGLAKSNGSLPPGLWLMSPAGWLPRTGISSGTLRSVIEYRLSLPFIAHSQ